MSPHPGRSRVTRRRVGLVFADGRLPDPAALCLLALALRRAREGQPQERAGRTSPRQRLLRGEPVRYHESHQGRRNAMTPVDIRFRPVGMGWWVDPRICQVRVAGLRAYLED